MRYSEANLALQAADSHNIASEGSSIFDELAQAPEFLAVSAVSGLNSLYNTGIAIGNVFKPEDEKTPYRETIDALDDDLGKYYEAHKTGADIVGFIATSFIPGMAGVKALRYGQEALRVAKDAGRLGSNLSRATNLLAPKAEQYVAREGATLAARSAQFSFANQNAIKAVASGAGQLALESLAFETAVAATMFASPILDDLSAGDIVKNIAFMTVFGAGLGAIGGAATTYFGVKKLVKAADARQQEFVTQATQLSERSNHADAIVVAADDLSRLQKPITVEDVLASKLRSDEKGFSISAEAVQMETDKLNRLREAAHQRFSDEIRTSVHGLVGETRLGNQLTDLVEKFPGNGFANTFTNMLEGAPLYKATRYEQDAAKLAKAGKTPGEIDIALADRTKGYFQMHSGTIGQTTDTQPFRKLADRFDVEGINSFVSKQGFKFTEPFHMSGVKDSSIAEARWIWAEKVPSKWPKEVVIAEDDLPLLYKAYQDKLNNIHVVDQEGTKRLLQNSDEIQQQILAAKEQLIHAHKAQKHTTDFIETVSDVSRDAIEGLLKGEDFIRKGLFAQTAHAKQLSTLLGKEISEHDLRYMPKFSKFIFTTAKSKVVDGHELSGIQLIKYRSMLYQQGVDNVVVNWAGERGLALPAYDDSLLLKANRTGAGHTFAGNAGATYNSAEEMHSYIGQVVSEIERAKVKTVHTALDSPLTALIGDSRAAVEFSLVNETASQTPELYVLYEGTQLIPRKVLKAIESGDEKFAQMSLEEIAEAVGVAEGTKLQIPLTSQVLRDAVTSHISQASKTTTHRTGLKAALGEVDDRYTDVFRPIRPDPREYKHVAFVKDETLVGVGHTRMLFAPSAAELEAQISKVPKQYKVYTKGQSESFYKARNEWEFDRTLHENYLDESLPSRGIFSRYLPQTDPQKIANSILNYHIKAESSLVKQMIVAKYQPQINELTRLGAQYADVPGSAIERIQNLGVSEKRNPYASQVKAMLNVSNVDEASWWMKTQRSLDDNVSKVWDTATKIFTNPKLSDDAKIAEINSTFDQFGFKSAYYDAATNLLANSSLPRGALTSFVRKSNAFLTTTLLRLDVFQAANSLFGTSIMLSTELKNLTRGIEKASPEAAGELSKLMRVALPGAEQSLIRSPSKLMASATQRLIVESPLRKQLIDEYTLRGFKPDMMDQIYKGLDSMTMTGSESLPVFNSKVAKLGEAWKEFAAQGEKWTGNKWAEGFQRLVAVDSIRQITDIAVKHGVMKQDAAWAMINTFNSRINGVIRAAERPLMFQGPVGQAIGLFQSYQFNLMQQIFRHVGEGNKKSLAMLGGLQGSIYGAASLPGFELINTHLIGSASGNTNHTDIYSASQAIFGKTGAEWLMYGAPSNLINASLYSRGNTNPRSWHIVPNPTNPGEIPFISSYAQAIGSLAGIAGKVAKGAPVFESFVSGIEHLGLSRPLAGMAQVARTLSEGQPTSTQKSGNILGSNDLVSLSTLVRIAGSKPLDEATIQGNYFRILGYRAADVQKRKALGTAMKATMLAGGMPSEKEVEDFALSYAKAGGRQSGFNAFMMTQYVNATKSQAEQLSKNLSSPYSKTLQALMGGAEEEEILE